MVMGSIASLSKVVQDLVDKSKNDDQRWALVEKRLTSSATSLEEDTLKGLLSAPAFSNPLNLDSKAGGKQPVSLLGPLRDATSALSPSKLKRLRKQAAKAKKAKQGAAGDATETKSVGVPGKPAVSEVKDRPAAGVQADLSLALDAARAEDLDDALSVASSLEAPRFSVEELSLDVEWTFQTARTHGGFTKWSRTEVLPAIRQQRNLRELEFLTDLMDTLVASGLVASSATANKIVRRMVALQRFDETGNKAFLDALSSRGGSFIKPEDQQRVSRAVARHQTLEKQLGKGFSPPGDGKRSGKKPHSAKTA